MIDNNTIQAEKCPTSMHVERMKRSSRSNFKDSEAITAPP